MKLVDEWRVSSFMRSSFPSDNFLFALVVLKKTSWIFNILSCRWKISSARKQLLRKWRARRYLHNLISLLAQIKERVEQVNWLMKRRAFDCHSWQESRESCLLYNLMPYRGHSRSGHILASNFHPYAFFYRVSFSKCYF